MSAFFTAMHQYPFVTSALHRDRLHHAAALGGSVARLDIDMLAPEALRTMIGVAIASDSRAAMFALEILYSAEKTHVRY